MKNLNKNTSVTYTLLLYREQLSRKKAKPLKLSSLKIALTDKLTSEAKTKVYECSQEDLQALVREMHYKEKLRRILDMLRMRILAKRCKKLD